MNQEEYKAWYNGISPLGKEFLTKFEQAHEILIDLVESLPRGCNCDGEYIDGRIHGTVCNAHKAEQFLNELGL